MPEPARKLVHLVDSQPPGIACARCDYRAATLLELEAHGAEAHGVGLSGRALVACANCATKFDSMGAGDDFCHPSCEEESRRTLRDADARRTIAAERRAGAVVADLFGLPEGED